MNHPFDSKIIATRQTLPSGRIGWRGRLRASYDGSKESFLAYCDNYGIHEQLGYKTPEEAWQENPVIEGSVIPEDFRISNQEDW